MLVVAMMHPVSQRIGRKPSKASPRLPQEHRMPKERGQESTCRTGKTEEADGGDNLTEGKGRTDGQKGWGRQTGKQAIKQKKDKQIWGGVVSSKIRERVR